MRHKGRLSFGRMASALCALVTLCAPAVAEEMPPFPITITKPAGNGPFPAVVILHDCSGLGPRSSGSPWRWASRLMAWGYVTAWPDSFSWRGFPSGVCTDPSRRRVSYVTRAQDAYATLSYLQSLPYVDAKRISVMGGSHGGASTLATIVDTPANVALSAGGFAAAVALYPNCGWSFGDWTTRRERKDGKLTFGYSGVFKPRAPLLILIGDLDDWTPAEHCRKLAEAAAAAGQPVEIKVYPGVHHSFDSIAPVRFEAARINPNAFSGRGATVGGNAEAWADSVIRVEQFLATQLPKR